MRSRFFKTSLAPHPIAKDGQKRSGRHGSLVTKPLPTFRAGPNTPAGKWTASRNLHFKTAPTGVAFAGLDLFRTGLMRYERKNVFCASAGAKNRSNASICRPAWEKTGAVVEGKRRRARFLLETHFTMRNVHFVERKSECPSDVIIQDVCV